MLWRIAAFAALGGFLFGYDLGVMGGALLGISREFGTSEWSDGLIVGAAKFGACFGAFLGGALMLHYGRRVAISVDSLLFMAGPLIMASARGVTALVVGRLFVGLGIGVSAVVVPAYLGEMAPSKSRGTLVELYEVLLCIGMLMALVVDWLLSALPSAWRWMLAVPFVPALVMSVALFVVPESPRWLVVTGRLDEALAVLQRILASSHAIGTQTSMEEAEQELLELWSSVEKDNAALQQRTRQGRIVNNHRGSQRAGLGKHVWHTVSSAEPETSTGIERTSGRILRRTPIRSGPSNDRTPPLLPLFGMAEATRGDGASQRHAHAQRGDDDGLAPIASRVQHPITNKRQQHLRAPDRHVAGSRQESLKGMTASASGPCLRSVHSAGSAASTPTGGWTEGLRSGLPTNSAVPMSSSGINTAAGKSVVQRSLPRPQSQPNLYTASTSAAADMQMDGALSGAKDPAVTVGSSKEQRHKQRWQNYNEGSGSSSSSCSGREHASSCQLQISPLRHSQITSTKQEPSLYDSTSDPPESHGEASQPLLQGQPSRALTVCTDCGTAASPLGTASPVLWFDDKGTPQFHQSLKAVPVGLSPIRTKSEEVEFHHRASALKQAATRQGVAAPERTSCPAQPSASSSLKAEEAQALAAVEPSFASTLVAMFTDIGRVARGNESGAFRTALWLAFFNQACASTAIINFAPQLIHQAGGFEDSKSILVSSMVSASKVVGVMAAMLLIDRIGRKPLLLMGSTVSTVAVTVLAMSDTVHSAWLVVGAMCAFIVAFSASWAGVFWVLMSELFSMSVKSPAIAAATAALFLTGAVTDFLFLALHRIFGGGVFLLYAAVSAVGGVYVYRYLPETRGKNLEEIQTLMASLQAPSEARSLKRGHSNRSTDLRLSYLRADVP